MDCLIGDSWICREIASGVVGIRYDLTAKVRRVRGLRRLMALVLLVVQVVRAGELGRVLLSWWLVVQPSFLLLLVRLRWPIWVASYIWDLACDGCLDVIIPGFGIRGRKGVIPWTGVTQHTALLTMTCSAQASRQIRLRHLLMQLTLISTPKNVDLGHCDWIQPALDEIESRRETPGCVDQIHLT